MLIGFVLEGTGMAEERTDSALISAAKQGDTAAFEKLVRAHGGAVYAHALRFFGDSATAEDIVQEVFLKVYRSLATFDGTAAFSTWLFRVTRNACLDELRRGKRVPMPVDPVDLVSRPTPDHAEGVIDNAVVEQAMRALQPEDREALGAVTLFGMSYAEAGQALGVPVGTVKSRAFRARRILAALLGTPGGDGQ